MVHLIQLAEQQKLHLDHKCRLGLIVTEVLDFTFEKVYLKFTFLCDL